MSVLWRIKAIGLGVVTLSLSVELLNWLFHRLKPKKVLNEVLFFPSDLACVEHIFSPTLTYSCVCPLPHGVETSFSRLLCHIMSASSSLDLSVFAFSNIDLCRAILALHSKGVVIRVFTDKDYAAIRGSQIGTLRKAGVCVRSSDGAKFMHHKFVVLDGRLLITGSLNWTLGAVQNNEENLIITEEQELLQPFILEFNKLWVKYDPDRLRHASALKPVHNQSPELRSIRSQSS